MHIETPDKLDAAGLRIGLAVSRYHGEITDSMRDAAIQAFVDAGGRHDDLLVAAAAGSFELTAVCRGLVMLEGRGGRPALDAVIAIGCIITGQTTHDQYIAQSVTNGLTDLIVQTGVPIAFSVLTCQNFDQARARSVGSGQSGLGNKGREAMAAAIESARTLHSLASRRIGSA